MDYINITPENIDTEHLSCIIRMKKPHPGVEKKREWLRERLSDGHVFRKLDFKGCAFIEYSPLDKAWVPIVSDAQESTNEGNFIYIYCLWVTGEAHGKGVGRELIEYCISDARSKGYSGVCMLGSDKQKAWLSNQSFAKKFGFEKVDATSYGYELLALSFDGKIPRFTESARAGSEDKNGIALYYDFQCPYILERITKVKEYCEEKGIPADFIEVDTLEEAKSLPCVFNNFALMNDGKLVTVNLPDPSMIERLKIES